MIQSFSRILGVTLFMMLMLNAPGALAWGWEGHKLICGLAERKLTPEATRWVDQLLKDGAELSGGPKGFAESCLWPDDVKYKGRESTYEHHFINVPDDAQTVNLQRDCAAINCTVVGVQQALTYLSRPASGEREVKRRAAALRFLGHYVGDLHQPMHVGNASDWGGNKIKVKWFKKSANLHGIWDYEILDTAGIKYPKSLDFLASIEVDHSNPDIMDWFNESLALGRSHAYVNTRGKLIKSGDRIGKRYFEKNKPVALERLVLASERLADLLNAIAAGDQPRVFVLEASGIR